MSEKEQGNMGSIIAFFKSPALPSTLWINSILVLLSVADYLESSLEDLLDEAKALMRDSKHDDIVNIQGMAVWVVKFPLVGYKSR